jgi:thiamine biosynthesis lipoprotein
MQKIEFHAMGSRMLAALDVDSPQAVARLAQVPGWFEEWERHLSRFREDSELSQLNRQSSAPKVVSPVLWTVLEAACQGARMSGGLVVPTVLAALEAAGYDRTFEAVAGGQPAAAELTAAASPSAMPDWRAIQRHTRSHAVRLPPGVRLDFGGIAKGWAADQAARRLAATGPALVDAGGDIAVSGPMADGSRWPIGVADPLVPEEQLYLLGLAEACVATSGRDYHRWQRGGVWQHHILDPRTGQPAQTNVLSATVIAPSAREAEVAAKTVLILGERAGLEWLEARPALAGLVVLDDGQVITSLRLPAYLWS